MNCDVANSGHLVDYLLNRIVKLYLFTDFIFFNVSLEKKNFKLNHFLLALEKME